MDPSNALVPTTISISSFRSFRDTVHYRFRDGYQAIIGKNGAGKSTLLRAIALTDVDNPVPDDWLPQALGSTRKEELRTNADTLVLVECRYKAYRSFIQPESNSDELVEVAVCRFASGRREIRFDGELLPETDAEALVQCVALSRLLHDLINTSGTVPAERHSTPSIVPGDPLPADYLATVAEIEEIESRWVLKASQQELTAEDVATHTHLSTVVTQMREVIEDYDHACAKAALTPAWAEQLPARIPRISYLPPEYELPDSFTLPQSNSSTTVSKLLQHAEIDPAADTIDSVDLVKGLETLNAFVEKWYTQEPLTINLSPSPNGWDITIRGSAGEIVRPSQLPDGTKWALPFAINLIADLGTQHRNSIILVDDPGVHLHPDALRNDLRRQLEELGEQNVVVVATHSPFLLNPKRSENIIVFEKGPTGAVIRERRRGGWSDQSAFRAAVGMTVGDSLFGNSWTVLVEGASDKLYLETFVAAYLNSHPSDGIAKVLKKTGFVSFDGEEDKMEMYAKWFESENRAFLMLTDLDADGLRYVSAAHDALGFEGFGFRLPKSALRSHAPEDSTIEDVFDREFFKVLSLRAYANILGADGVEDRENKSPDNSNSGGPGEQNVNFLKHLLRSRSGDNEMKADKMLLAVQLRMMQEDGTFASTESGVEPLLKWLVGELSTLTPRD